MKKILLLLIVISCVSACAPGPIGAWNYSVTGTPQGDYKGILIINKTNKGYAAKMQGDAGETTFNKFTYVKKEQKTEGDFDFSGVNILFSAKLDKDQLKGIMSTSGMEFPFSGTRKKEVKK